MINLNNKVMKKYGADSFEYIFWQPRKKNRYKIELNERSQKRRHATSNADSRVFTPKCIYFIAYKAH